MELIIKHFSELTTEELMQIYKLRIAVFVVEQNCPYQDIDGWDPHAYHLWLKDGEGIQAYLREQPQKTLYADASMGRVISVKRRCGLATRLLREGIGLAREKFGAKRLIIGAQTYACPVYEKVGFVRTDYEYMEDGIPHVRMIQEFE